MQWVVLIGLLVVSCFAFVLISGAPYVPTLTKQAELALDMLALESGETLLELGSGDGKILLAAARRGWNAVGIELNPILVIFSRLRTWRYRRQVKIIWGNMWLTSKWPQADGIFAFQLPKHMQKLDDTINQWHTKPVKLVSFAFPMPNKNARAQHESGVYVYEYN